MAGAPAKKTTAVHPRTGTSMQIDRAVYNPFKAAILKSLGGKQGKTFTELTEAVTAIIRKKLPAFDRSIPWYTITIRLDLESRGLVETYTEKGRKLNRLAAKKK